jgi:hypothetical protein
MRAVQVRATTYAVVLTLTAACTDAPTRVTAPAPADASPTLGRSADKLDRLRAWLRRANAGGNAPILVGAGDIAECYQGSTPPPLNEVDAEGSAAERTAELLDRIPGTVIAIGDNAYQFGSTFDYEACYEPTWGRHYERTRPATGNHEYMSAAEGYLAYFGPRGGPPGLYYYSYDVGDWHVVVLNSTTQVYMCYPPELSEVENESGEWWQTLWPEPQLDFRPTSAALGRLCAGDAAQQLWLAADLTASAGAKCTLVYWHHPRFSSGHHGNHYQMQRIWDLLYRHGVDVAVTGHDHNYERFAPQDLNGRRDRRFGIRQFVVGTGGADLRPVNRRIRNSEVAIDDTHGVIAIALGSGSYSWAFIGVDRSVRDAGRDQCHDAPPA